MPNKADICKKRDKLLSDLKLKQKALKEAKEALLKQKELIKTLEHDECSIKAEILILEGELYNE